MSDLTNTLKELFLETLREIEPASVIARSVSVDPDRLIVGDKHISLDAYGAVVVIGMGKASLKMGASIEHLLGERLTRGILVTDRGAPIEVRSEVIVAGHPLPDANSLIAGQRVTDLIESCADDALIIFLISGGGSSLVELPIDRGISLEDFRLTNKVLTTCGASIHEINVVRKHLSRIKAGGLGYLARATTCVALYFSDVNPGDVRAIASNPLLPEILAEEELRDIIERFKLRPRLPASVSRAIGDKKSSAIRPKWNWENREPVIKLLLDNSDVIRVASRLAKLRDLRVDVDDGPAEEDYRQVAQRSVERLLKLKDMFPGERVCVITGGEVLCTVHGEGVGGRNQEFVLYSAALLAGKGLRENAAVLSAGTDGIDGNSKVAGAVADAESIAIAAVVGSDAAAFIQTNNSHSFFKQTGGLIVTGPSGNNVRDLRILIAQ
jgi:glycerate-2-kinase